MPQADPAECVMDRRETGLHSTAPLQLGPELGQREVGHRLDQPAQVGFVRFQHRPPVAAVARQFHAIGICSSGRATVAGRASLRLSDQVV